MAQHKFSNQTYYTAVLIKAHLVEVCALQNIEDPCEVFFTTSVAAETTSRALQMATTKPSHGRGVFGIFLLLLDM